MQGAVDRMSKAFDNFHFTISTKKTAVVHHPAPWKPYSKPTITLNGQKLQVVNKFTYMGSTLWSIAHWWCSYDQNCKKSVAFSRFCWNVWERNVRETWTVYQRQVKTLNHFNLSCLRNILIIRRQDKIPDTEVLKKAKEQSAHTLLKLAKLRWAGHVTIMLDKRLPNKVIHGELQEGKLSQGEHKKHYKGTLKASHKDYNIPTEPW